MFDAESDRTSATGIPMTGGQAGIWPAQQIEPDSSAYNIVFALDLRGSTDLGRLAAAVRQAVAEADCLHVEFAPGDGDGGPRQSATTVPFEVPVVDLRDAPDPEAAAADWAAAERERPAPWTGHRSSPRHCCGSRTTMSAGTSATTTSCSTAWA